MSEPTKQKYSADGYVDVAERIVEFRTKYPDGSLQPNDRTVPYRIETLGDQTYIVVVAAAYRTPDDERPGVGMAYEQFPGRTNFTRGSELQNAETSAWGRAIVAALAADTKRGIASAQEVRGGETRDLGQWRGLVAAAGRDQGKLQELWQRMVAEWDNVPWSPDRQSILERAVEAAKRPAEPAQARPAPPPADEPRPADDPNEAAAAAEWDANWRAKLDEAAKASDARAVRALIKVAAEAKAPALKAEGMAVLDAFRTGA